MKVVINTRCGGFGLSKAAYQEMGLDWDGFGYAFVNDRTNEKLVACVESLGSSANGEFARLKVVDVPDGVSWRIAECCGSEHVEEIHRTWS